MTLAVVFIFEHYAIVLNSISTIVYTLILILHFVFNENDKARPNEIYKVFPTLHAQKYKQRL